MRPKSIIPIILGLTLCALTGNSQPGDSVRVPAIPRGLFWENAPRSFKANRNNLAIEAGEKTDMFRDPNVTYNTDNAPKLMFRADENFVLSASIEHAFANKWDGGAFVVKQDNMNWIKFCFEKDYTGARRVVSVVTRDISDDCNSSEINSNKVFYKIAKAENVFTLYYSLDGRKWFLVRHLQFNTSKGFTVGFLAQSPTGDRCEVRFSDIEYKPIKIKDPYVGE